MSRTRSSIVTVAAAVALVALPSTGAHATSTRPHVSITGFTATDAQHHVEHALNHGSIVQCKSEKGVTYRARIRATNVVEGARYTVVATVPTRHLRFEFVQRWHRSGNVQRSNILLSGQRKASGRVNVVYLGAAGRVIGKGHFTLDRASC